MNLSKVQIMCVAGLIFFALIISATAFSVFSVFSKQERDLCLYIDADDTVDSVYVKLAPLTSDLKLNGLIICGKVMNYREHFHTGRYVFKPYDSAFRIMRKIRSGIQSPVQVVIPIVHTLGDLSSKLSSMLMPDSTQFYTTFLSPEILQELGTDSANIISYFIPNTYEIYWNTTPKKFILRMKREHDVFWNEAKRNKAASMNLTIREVYTLASIVQQESGNAQERPIIAGMYLNRLQKRMMLQADPTVKFALQQFALQRLYHKHLEVESPYNTYKQIGLPIGPICIPSLNAIESVLNYTKHSYLYMCAKEDFSGTHNFSTTYREHQQNANRYAKALNKRNIYR